MQIYSSGLVKNKTLPDNLHYAACKQSDSRIDTNARSLDSERSERAPIDRRGPAKSRNPRNPIFCKWLIIKIHEIHRL